jgi:hypothetical protein
MKFRFSVISAEAGIQFFKYLQLFSWTPVFTGATKEDFSDFYETIRLVAEITSLSSFLWFF